MQLDAEKMIEDAVRDGLREALKYKLTRDYNNPLDKIISDTIAQNSDGVRSLLSESLKSCLNDAESRSNIAASVRSTLAKSLVQRFGGELEKQVNVLKSDPATRARITLATEEIVKQKTAVGV